MSPVKELLDGIKRGMFVSELAEKLGIPRDHLAQALTLVRDFRLEVLVRGLDRKASRVALIYANLVDEYFAKKVLSERDMALIDEIAHQLFREARGEE